MQRAFVKRYRTCLVQSDGFLDIAAELRDIKITDFCAEYGKLERSHGCQRAGKNNESDIQNDDTDDHEEEEHAHREKQAFEFETEIVLG